MDEIDAAGEHIEKTEAAMLAANSKAAANIPTGKPGECAYCGEWFERTVKNACGRCRDEFKLL